MSISYNDPVLIQRIRYLLEHGSLIELPDGFKLNVFLDKGIALTRHASWIATAYFLNDDCIIVDYADNRAFLTRGQSFDKALSSLHLPEDAANIFLTLVNVKWGLV